MIRLGRTLACSWRDLEFRVLLGLAAVILSGPPFYRQVEGWDFPDSLPLSVLTLATVGCGDLSPATSIGKVFTVFYALTGIGGVPGFVDKVAERPSSSPSGAR